MIDIATFANERSARFYGPLLEVHRSVFERLFALLNDPENEAHLIEASEEGRPAIEGIVRRRATRYRRHSRGH